MFQIQTVNSLILNKNSNNELDIFIDVTVPTSGWTNLMLVPIISQNPPLDGIYEFYPIMNSPNPGDTVLNVLESYNLTFIWSNYPKDLKGIKIGIITISL